MADYNASERKDVRAAEKAARLAEAQRAEIVKNLMSSIPGRDYVWSKLAAAHMFVTSFSSDPLQMAFAEGERNQGLSLLNDIMGHCPEQFILAMREQNERRNSGSKQQPGREDGDGGVEGSDDDTAGGVEAA